MNPFALFMVDLQMAQGRLQGVFDVVDEMRTTQLQTQNWPTHGKRDGARSESSLDVHRATALISPKRWRLESTERHA